MDEYNYRHFRRRHLLDVVAGTVRTRGLRPGSPAPDFDLPRAGDGRLKLSELRGRPVLVHFGSYT